MFENKIYEDIYYSRFVASWVKAGGGKIDYRFEDWLATLEINGKKIPYDIIREIYLYGENGKLELELSAEKFLHG